MKQPSSKPGAGKIAAASCLGITMAFGLAAGCVAVVTDTGGEASEGSSSASSKKEPGEGAKNSDEDEDDPAPVELTAEKTKFEQDVLADNSHYTSVRVTIRNNSETHVSVNPLYFTFTDTNGTKHSAELAVDRNQIDVLELVPGEKATGTISAKGKLDVKYVTYTDGLFSDPVKADVS